MTSYLFLKFARIAESNAPRRGLTDSGIDIRLLQLLSARYV
jgi:hypothetical protein